MMDEERDLDGGPGDGFHRMWSPWRAKHVSTWDDRRLPPGEGSLFTRLASDPARDEELLVLWRGETVFVVMNRYPYNPGHLMVVPYREVADPEALTPEERRELADVTIRAVGWLRRAMNPKGFNIGMNVGAAGGASVKEHLHQHVVPRWKGDTNFMPVVGATKVLPEALEDTYRKLRAVVQMTDDG